jgi:hypothetical protein
MTQDQLDLLHGYLNGTLDEADFARFQSLLRESAEARHTLRSLSTVEAKLTQLAAIHPETVRLLSETARQSGPSFRWLSWRPLTAAAAGIVFGMFCTSVVFGFVVQRQMRTQTLLSEGFEDAGMPVERGLPQRAGVWSGDLSAPETDNANARPAEGSRMVRLPPVDKRKFSYAMRFMEAGELPPSGTAHTRQIEVTASFHGDGSPVSGRYQIRMAAFAGTLTEAREIWLGGHVDEQALMHVARTISTAPGQHGWTPVRTEMEVPAQTRWVLISLAAAVADEAAAKTAHYLDDVQIRVITHEAQP